MNSNLKFSVAHSHPFQLPELSETSLRYAQKFGKISIGAFAQNFSGNDYSEKYQSMAIGYGFRKVRFGVRIDRVNFSVARFDGNPARSQSQWSFRYRIGTLLKLSESFEFLTSFDLSHRKNYSFGINFLAEETVRFFVDFHRIKVEKIKTVVGSEISTVENFRVILAVKNEPWEASIGFTVIVGFINFNYAWLSNLELAGTHQLSIGLLL